MDSTITIDNTVAGEVVRTRRAEKMMDGPRGVRRVLAYRKDVVLFVDEFSQATGSKFRNQDVPNTSNAEEVDFRPPPIEMRGRVAKSVPALRKRHSIHAVRSEFRLIDQLERSRNLFRAQDQLLRVVQVSAQGVPGKRWRLTAGRGQEPRNAMNISPELDRIS